MIENNNKIPFGLKNGVMFSVSDVPKGLACECICPQCHRKLQANKGRKVAHYFSHNPSENTVACESACETSIHLMAKQILSEEKCAFVPELSIKLEQTDVSGVSHEECGVVEYESLKRFDLVQLEKKLGDVRPDIIAYEGSLPFLIEIAVTHFADSEKISLLRNRSLNAIEIDASNVSYTTTKEELRELIVDGVENKRWLSNLAAVQLKKQLKESLERKIREINEEIYRKRRKPATTVTRAKVPTSKVEQSSVLYKPKRTKQYDPRWFLCEACRHLFSVPLRNAPYTIKTIQCPECDYSASAE